MPINSDEFCHFLLRRCTCSHESGEVIEIVPGTVAFFPQDWKGTCRVHETIRKVYMIRWRRRGTTARFRMTSVPRAKSSAAWGQPWERANAPNSCAARVHRPLPRS
jgi:hypothetical protein